MILQRNPERDVSRPTGDDQLIDCGEYIKQSGSHADEFELPIQQGAPLTELAELERDAVVGGVSFPVRQLAEERLADLLEDQPLDRAGIGGRQGSIAHRAGEPVTGGAQVSDLFRRRDVGQPVHPIAQLHQEGC